MKRAQCMGGWCQQRDKCAHYTAPAEAGLEPVERLCRAGDERPLVLVPRRRAPARRFVAGVAV